MQGGEKKRRCRGAGGGEAIRWNGLQCRGLWLNAAAGILLTQLEECKVSQTFSPDVGLQPRASRTFTSGLIKPNTGWRLTSVLHD